MKKRIWAAVLSLALLLTLSAPPVRAEESVYFTAGDGNVVDLTNATMPFWFGGYIYVAASLFRECGLVYNYNTVSQTAVLYTSSKSLVFNVAENSATDGQGNPYAHGAILKRDVVFLPAKPVATFFDLTYSNIQVNHGYLIRVSSPGTMNDAFFANAAESTLESRYRDYVKANTPVPVTPTPPVPAETEEEPEPQTPAAKKTIYLSLEVLDPEVAVQWQETLRAWGVHATFYFGDEVLSRSGALLRQLAAEGQSVGLLVAPGTEPLEEKLSRMNRVLFDAAGLKTRLILLRNGASGDAAGLTAAGYCLLDPKLDRSSYGLTSSGGAAALLKQISSRRSASLSVWLGGNVTSGALRLFLSGAKEANHRLLAITETTP